jgi:hypothetical protein
MKHYKLFGFAFTTFLLMMTGVSLAQLSGNYTVGGSNPDFATLTDVTTALQTQGVNGAVTFNLRAGTFKTNGGTERALEIQEIPGVSATNIVTFQADATSGANVDNTIISRSSGAQVGGYIALIRSGFVAFQDLTFQTADTSGSFWASGVLFLPMSRMDSVSILGCKFISVGNVPPNPALQIGGPGDHIRVENNHFEGTRDGIFITGLNDVEINNNSFRKMDTYYISNALGTTIWLEYCNQYTINGNDIDHEWLWNSLNAIAVREGGNGIISGNRIRNVPYQPYPYEGFHGIWVISGTGLPVTISNNMISNIIKGAIGIEVRGANYKVYHNSIVYSSTANTVNNGIQLYNVTNSHFMNNMIVSCACGNFFTRIFNISSSSGNTFNYNNLYSEPFRIEVDGTVYDSLAAWQTTGNGTNSISVLPEFLGDHATDVHLADCSLGDSTLWGTPLPEVTVDFDGEVRDPVHPYIGADEVDTFRPDIFTPLSFTSVNDVAVHFTTGDLDNDGYDDIAVVNNYSTNGGSEDVSLFWNDGLGNFSGPNHIPFGTQPTIIRAADVDGDNLRDLLVAGSNDMMVRYGQGGGSFDAVQNLPMYMPITDFASADFDNDGDLDIARAHQGIVGVQDGDMSILTNEGNRLFFVSDTASGSSHPSAIIAVDLNNDGFLDLATSDFIDGAVSVLINNGLDGSNAWLGFPNTAGVYTTLRGAGPLHANLSAADIDGDGSNDILIGNWASAEDSLAYLHNDGSGQFTVEYLGLDRRRPSHAFSILDYEGDGDPDIISATNQDDLVLYRNDGLGAFEMLRLCQTTEYYAGVLTTAIGNFNNDPFPDVAVLTRDEFSMMLNLNYTVGFGEDETVQSIVPQDFRLEQNYPNPFNPSTTIRFELPVNSRVDLRVYNLLGQEVEVLINNEELSSGVYKYNFDATQLTSGVYFYRIITKDFVQTKKMVLLR